MTKTEEISDPESAWNRTADDEPVFAAVAIGVDPPGGRTECGILVGHDAIAWEAVLEWAQRAEEIDVRDEKVNEAREQAWRNFGLLHRDAKARAAFDRVWNWVRFGDVDPDEAALRKRVADDQLRDFRSEVAALSPIDRSNRFGLAKP